MKTYVFINSTGITLTPNVNEILELAQNTSIPAMGKMFSEEGKAYVFACQQEAIRQMKRSGFNDICLPKLETLRNHNSFQLGNILPELYSPTIFCAIAGDKSLGIITNLQFLGEGISSFGDSFCEFMLTDSHDNAERWLNSVYLRALAPAIPYARTHFPLIYNLPENARTFVPYAKYLESFASDIPAEIQSQLPQWIFSKVITPGNNKQFTPVIFYNH